MLIDGYIIKVDYTEQKKLAAAVSRAASNINQICRRINSTGRCQNDVAELKARQTEIWTAEKCGREKSFDHNRIFHVRVFRHQFPDGGQADAPGVP